MADYLGGGSYGALGSEFNPVEFLRKPDVIFRLAGWIFSIVVFGCISSQGWVNNGTCVYNNNHGACGFGTFVGVMAFLGLMTFLVVAAMFENLSNVEHRKIVVLAEVGFSGIFAFFWFVCFCYLTNQWASTPEKHSRSGPEAAIAFSFFSIFIFIGLTFFAIQKFRLGLSSPFHHSYYDQDFERDTSPLPYTGSQAYQGGGPMIPPFTATEEITAQGSHQPQTY